MVIQGSSLGNFTALLVSLDEAHTHQERLLGQLIIKDFRLDW